MSWIYGFIFWTTANLLCFVFLGGLLNVFAAAICSACLVTAIKDEMLWKEAA